MKPMYTTLAGSLLAGVFLLNAQVAVARTNMPPATATRPAKTPTEQSSVPNNSPAGHHNPRPPAKPLAIP